MASRKAPPDMLLTARYVLPVTSPHISDGAVLVRDDAIVEVGPREELVAKHPDEPVRDFGLAALLPGFVDLHTHLEYTVFRGLVNDLPYTRWKLQLVERQQVLDAEDWQESAMLGALETLRSGITTIADITASGASAGAAVAAGLRGVIYREVSTMRKAEVPEVMARAADDVAAWSEAADPTRLRVGLAPHSPYSCHPELYRAVATEARSRGLLVSTHLAGSRDEYEFVKYGSTSFATDFEHPSRWSDVGWLPTGVSPVRYLLQWGFFDVPGILGVHCVQVDEDDIDVLAGRGVMVAYCARCNAKLGMGVAPLKSFMSRGMTVGIGTDSPASNATMDFFDEMRFGMMLQRAIAGEGGFLSAEQFVRMATIDGARALGMDAEIGSLEPGKKADLVAVGLSHSHQIPTQDPYSALVFTANQENVLMTMIGGRVMFEDGEWSTLDGSGIKERAEPIRVKLRG